jgi:hypothetical protein
MPSAAMQKNRQAPSPGAAAPLLGLGEWICDKKKLRQKPMPEGETKP